MTIILVSIELVWRASALVRTSHKDSGSDVAHAPSNVKDKSFAFIAIVARPPGRKTLLRAAFTLL
jgi:hypothetical protein